MSTYIVGDIHGCFSHLQNLLKKVSFNPKYDMLWVSGDMVSRGPESLDVVRYLFSLGNHVKIVLGNHDLNLIAVHAGVRKAHREDQITEFLKASDADQLINWLRKQPLLQIDEDKKIIMVHAGILPQWSIEDAKLYSKELQLILSSDDYSFFLDVMHGDTPNHWMPNLKGLERFRFIVNVFTRMRYCFPDGRLNMLHKESPSADLFPLKPWFSIKNKFISENYCIFFGHWSNLAGKGTPKKIIALDTGCCWGGGLSMVRVEDKIRFFQKY